MHREGIFPSLERNLIVNASAVWSVTGWAVAAAVKTSVLNAPVWNTVRWTTLLAIGISLSSLLLVVAIARLISAPIVELQQQAPTLVSGHPATLGHDLPAVWTWF